MVTRGRRRMHRPSIESLEDRRLFACRVWEQDGVLNILGDNRRNSVLVSDFEYSSAFDGPAFIEVVCDGEVYQPEGPVFDILIDLGGGSDDLTYVLGDPQQSPDLASGPIRNLAVSMGNGNDSVSAFVQGFASNDPDFPALGPGQWRLEFDLGKGRDQFVLELDADLLGIVDGEDVLAADLFVSAEGGSGNDTLFVDIPRPVVISNTFLDFILGGGTGHDALSVRNDQPITIEDSTVHIERYGDQGNDGIFGVLSTEFFGNVLFDQVIEGGPGNDQVSLVFRQNFRPRRA
jgi:hypothetical protein